MTMTIVAGLLVLSLLLGLLIHRLSLIIPQQLQHQWFEESLDFLELEHQRADHQKKLSFTREIPGLFQSWSDFHVDDANYPSYVQWLIAVVTFTLLGLFYYQFGNTFVFYCLLPFIVLTVLASVIDLRYQLLPDKLVYPLLWLGLGVNTVGVFCSPVKAIWGAVLGYVLFSLISILVGRLRGQMVLGGGDPKYIAALGAWVGLEGLMPLILLSSVFLIIQSLLLMGSKQSLHSFGPGLSLAAMLILWLGSAQSFTLFRQISPF